MLDNPNSGSESRGVWLWAIFSTITLFVLEFILFAALVPSAWSERSIELERGWLMAAQGEASAEAVIERGVGWYESAFVRTGVEPWSYRLVTLGPDDDPGPGLEKMGEFPIWDWMAGRVTVIWDAVEQALVRISLLLAWIPFFVLAAVAAVGDGLVRRRIRQHSFAYASPLVHRYAALTLLWIALAAFFVLLLPVPIPTTTVPIAGLLVAIALDLLVTNSQKRL